MVRAGSRLLCKAASRLTERSFNEGAARPGGNTYGSNGGTGMNVASIVRCAKFAAVILAGLMIAGCAKQQVDQSSSSAAPGSQQDFVVNVGDRVFFETDSSELTEQAGPPRDKQDEGLSN